MSIKIKTIIYKCEEGHNFIVLDDSMQHIDDVDIDSLECPICGEHVVQEMTRELELN